jgi:hypothetical protein
MDSCDEQRNDGCRSFSWGTAARSPIQAIMTCKTRIPIGPSVESTREIADKHAMEYFDYGAATLFAIFVLRYGLPGLIGWFLRRFVKPRADVSKQHDSQNEAEETNDDSARRMNEMRKNLDELKARIDNYER